MVRAEASVAGRAHHGGDRLRSPKGKEDESDTATSDSSTTRRRRQRVVKAAGKRVASKAEVKLHPALEATVPCVSSAVCGPFALVQDVNNGRC